MNNYPPGPVGEYYGDPYWVLASRDLMGWADDRWSFIKAEPHVYPTSMDPTTFEMTLATKFISAHAASGWLDIYLKLVPSLNDPRYHWQIAKIRTVMEWNNEN